ncbi:mRNA-degrading endonuclease toxin of MazEF toxin-antitoxin module [Nocardiopsis composta]|uniref:mRNA-degrading endonuclease toxin of MazEF toxin-antitoxin module n=1 Tax=Nocardiopsis composta TaxID=157465 RepID=A0A7W8QMQ4_9ACTN|nr:mRNA-degrading endonuclease toxin of MazEF toxin-antitoxin module [Nocardiopsis composta]
MCDEITLLNREDLTEESGALSPATMSSAGSGLKAAPAL